MQEVTVDLGCGTTKFSGAIGIDRIPHVGVDIVCDFEELLPLKSNSVNSLHARHLLEHINDLITFMEEIYRVCKKDANVHITVPYLTSHAAFRDPTHVRFFSEETFLYFQHPTPYKIKTNFQIQEVHYKYKALFRILPKFIRKIFRKHLWNIVDEIKVSLKVEKS